MTEEWPNSNRNNIDFTIFLKALFVLLAILIIVPIFIAYTYSEEETINNKIMNKVEERALELYPPKSGIVYDTFGLEYEDSDINLSIRNAYLKGYYEAQKEVSNLWKDAQGDDLPEIDREVIVLVKALPEHEDSLLKVSFAHRPPEYWEGENIDTEKVTRYYPKRYDKGEWNIPDIKWWLDLDLPIKEELL